MVASPVLIQVEAQLRPSFNQAKSCGQINESTPFRIKSFPIPGSKERNYHCVDENEKVIQAVSPVPATPTICD